MRRLFFLLFIFCPLFLYAKKKGSKKPVKPVVFHIDLIPQIYKEALLGSFGDISINLGDFKDKNVIDVLDALSKSAESMDFDSPVTGHLYGDLTAYGRIEKSQESQIESQKIINDKLGKIDTLELKMQRYRSNLQEVMKKANRKEYLDSLVQDISDKQELVNKIAARHNEYMRIANETNVCINKRAKNIMKYIDRCGQYHGLKGQLDNKERTDMTLFVASELEQMNAMLLIVLNTMRTAANRGVSKVDIVKINH